MCIMLNWYMQNQKIGIDIEEISRFSKKDFFNHKSFYKKIFTEKEIKYCLSKSDPYLHFTGKFCAKEATIKAMEKPIDLHEIEILNIQNKPSIILPKPYQGMVSISHTKNYAVAIVALIDS